MPRMQTALWHCGRDEQLKKDWQLVGSYAEQRHRKTPKELLELLVGLPEKTLRTPPLGDLLGDMERP